MTEGGHPSNYHHTWAGRLTGPGPLRQSSSSNWDSISQCLPCWISPLLVLPRLDAHLPDSFVGPMQKEQYCTSSGALRDQCNKWTHVDSQEVEVSSEHSSTKGDEDMSQSWHYRLGPALNDKGRNLPVPLPVQPRPPLILVMTQWLEPQGAPGIRTMRAVLTTVGPHLMSDTSRENVADSDMEPASRWLSHVFRCTYEVTMSELPNRSTGGGYMGFL